MLLLRTDALPKDADRWEYQLKLDGYRAIAFTTGGCVHLRSRNDNDFSIRYPAVVKGLAKLPDEAEYCHGWLIQSVTHRLWKLHFGAD